MYDPNLHWVKVVVARPEEVDRVHAAISGGLDRPNLRPPIGDEVVVEFSDRHKADGAEAVQHVIEEELGNPEWIQIEVGHGNARWIYGPYPEGQRYLHDVMLSLLKHHPDGLTPAEISDAIARDGLFVGPRSSHAPEPAQISARASNHRDMFEIRGGRIHAR